MTDLFGTLDDKTAEMSPCGIYRYTLTREWEDGKCVAWIMFNPSTADASIDDPTIRKCVGFSRRWGFGRMIVVNLFAIRSTDPKTVRKTADPVGPLNNYWISAACKEAREVVLAWGCGQHFPISHTSRHFEVIRMLGDEKSITCLGKGMGGHPKHPLMLPYSTPRIEFLRP
jgi:hypothetical protein